MKNRVICKLRGRRLHGGYVFRKEDLTNALRKGDVMEYKGFIVGARQLKELVHLMPQDFCLIKATDSLQVETVGERWLKAGNIAKCHFVKNVHDYTMFKILKGAWLPKNPKLTPVTVVLQVEKY